MSSTPPHPFSTHRSPIRRRTTTSQVNDGGRWTVDNSESRFVSVFAAQSPSRSILKAPNTPLRFHYTSQEKRNEQLRRVSFAREAHLRVFDQNESPDITGRGIPNLFDESRPDYDDHAFNSPASNLFMSNYNHDSPSNRKRRPDLFGSPTAVQQSPKRRIGGAPPSLLTRLNENELDDEGSSADLTRYLSIQPRRNIFDEDDDDDEEEEEERDVSLRGLNLSGSEHLPTSASDQAFERIIEQTPEQVSEHTFEPTFEATPEPVSEPVFELGSEPVFEPTPERMSESVFDPAFEPTPERPSEPTFELPPRTTRIEKEDRRTELEATSPYNDQADDMIITQEVPLQHTDRESVVEEGSSIPYLEEETMLITQEMPTSFASPLYTPNRSTIAVTPVRSSFYNTTPERRPTTLNRTTPDRSSTLADNRRFNRTPERPTAQTETTSLNATPTRSSVLTPIRETRVLYSEERSFRLHERTPVRTNENETVEFDNVIINGTNADIRDEEHSQLYNTMQDGNIPQQGETLADFLSYVGITFPSSTPAKESRRISRINTDYGPATEADQAFAAAVVLPELALLKKKIQQLHDLSHKSQEAIDEIDRSVSAANPQVFSEYFDGEIATRTKIEEQMKEIKTFAALKSLQQWLDIWMKSLQPLVDELKKNSENLKLDEEKLANFKQTIEPKLSEIISYKSKLDPILRRSKEEEFEFEKIDHEKLDSYELEIDNLRLATQDLRIEGEELKKEEQDLIDREKKTEELLSQAQEEIRQAEVTIAKNKFVTRKELMSEKESFERLKKMGGWKMETPKDNILFMKLEHNVHIEIDQKKLADRKPDAVHVQMLDSRARTLGPVAQLVHGLTVIAQDKWEVDEIMQDIAIYWNRFMMIQSDLVHIQRRFWVDIKTLQYEEPDDAGVSCNICVYSFVARTKFTISFEIKPKDVMNYPSIDPSSLSLVINFGEIEHNVLKSIIEKELSTHGMDDIVDMLTTVLEKIAIPA